MALVGWWKLDGNTKDSSTKGRDGILFGTSLPTEGIGKTGKCYRFTNSDNGVDIPNANFTELTDFTMCAWINPAGSHQNYDGAIISSGDWNSDHWSFGIAQNNASIKIRRPNWTVPHSFSLNTWHHVVLSREGTTLKAYVNGNLVGTTTSSSYIPLTSNYANTMIGRETYAGGYFSFNGSISDVRIYDHALSDKEIKELSKAKILHYSFDDFQEPTVNLTPSNCDYGDFENGSTDGFGPYNNDSGSGKTVTLSVVDVDQEGIPRPPNGSQYVMKVTVNNSMNSTGNSGWYMRTSSAYGTVCEAGKTYVQSSWMLLPEDIGSHGYTNNTGITNISQERPKPDGKTWMRYTRTFTVGTSNYTGSLHWYARKNGVYSFYMDMHQLEEKDHVTPYAKNERTARVADSSGYGHNAELAVDTTPKWTDEAIVGQGAYEFNGSQDITLNESLPTPSDQITVAAWIKSNSIGSYQHVFSKGAKTVSCAIYQSKMYCKFTINGTNRNPIGPTTLQSNTLYHLAWVYDGKNIKYYINGELDYTSPDYVGSLSINDDPTFVGRETQGNNMRGIIDDLRVYATALSDEDIKDLYQTRASIDSRGSLHVKNGIIETGHKPLFFDYTVWQDGQTGSVGQFTQYGNSNRRVLGYDPWGKETVLWESFSDMPTGAGGIIYSSFPVDPTKMYRFSIWERRVRNGATYSHYYFGLNGYGSVNGVVNSSGNVTTNPYFTSGSMSSAVVQSLLKGWRLHVAYVFPHDYDGPISHPEAGRYTIEGKEADISCYKWLPETDSARFRTYAIYRDGDGDSTGALHHSVYPRIDICDGTEPSVQDLLNGFDSRYIDYVRSKGGSNPIALDIGDVSSIFGTIREVGLPVRYIRDWANGSTANTSNHWVEIEAYSGGVNVALGKSATSPILTDGVTTTNPYYGLGSGLRSVQVDLGEVYTIEMINVRHYYGDERTYHETKTEVSADGENWITVFDSAIEGTYKETSAGNTIICRPQSFSIDANGNMFVPEIKEV